MKGADRPREGIYRRVSVRMHGDERFMRLSPLQASGQALWIYLLTGPHTGPVPGVFVIGKAAMAEALDWEQKAFEEAFAEVLGEGLVEFDPKTRLWFIPNAIRHNMPANPNVVRSWRGPWALLPECAMRTSIAERLFTAVNNMSMAFGKAFKETSGKPLPEPSRKDSPKQEAVNSEQRTGVAPNAPGKPGRPSGGYTDSFQAVWAIYPNRAAKATAARAFAKLSLTPELLAKITAAIAAQKVLPKWTKDSGDFVPHLATWLNGRRWEDEAPASAPAQADVPAPDDWRASQAGIRSKGCELGLGDWDKAAYDHGRGEQWPAYRKRVLAAAAGGASA